ncbi:unnamed protein product [Echinostoma caproni]|uniref:Uncharacterized protein n=1 Tax=Echinostoma caproni TaxID=27848 RepID=A0A183AI71_9TREM|nr:unnamed protein product [Echinostoma caproni]
MPPYGHKYENSVGHGGSLRLSANIPRNVNELRTSLPKTPSNDSDGPEAVRYAAPPIQTGSRIRFAAPKAEPLPPAPKDIPCMTLTDPYDELTYFGEDYAIWEPDSSPTRPLTSFR